MSLTEEDRLRVSAAFGADGLGLDQRIIGAAERYQGSDIPALLADIAGYVCARIDAGQQQQLVFKHEHAPPSTSHPATNGVAPNSKKRKLDSSEDDTANWSEHVDFEAKDVSFAVPARKKMKLQLVSLGDGSGKSRGRLRMWDQKTGEVEHEVDLQNVDQIFCLPVPDKAQRQSNIVVIPKDGSGEQVVFALSDAKSKDAPDDDTQVTSTVRALDSTLENARTGKQVLYPDDNEFTSAIPQSHRKGEKAYHVKAFRNAKDGYLFFLTTGILFAFKKPLFYFPFHAIESISYTSVLQRTVNLVITASDASGGQSEMEFSMLDQADFAGIDDYIKRHSLNDASMAAQRRAKIHNVNKGVKQEETNGEAANGEKQSELEKAQQEIEDAEDEEEEDYDPGDEGESEGEGSDSEAEDAEDAEVEYGDAGDEEGAEEVEHDEEGV